MTTPRVIEQAELATAWNDKHPVGTPVRFWPGGRIGPGRPSVTRSRAWTLGDGTAVVSVEDYAGGIALSHVEPADPLSGTAAPTPLAELARQVLIDYGTLCDHPEDCVCSAARLTRVLSGRPEWPAAVRRPPARHRRVR
jgi:hypothetical protein